MIENVKYRSIDFFRYFLPGLQILGVSYLFQQADSDFNAFTEGIHNKTSNYSTINYVIIIIYSYVLGFAIDPIGRYYLSIIKKTRFWKGNNNPSTNGNPSSMSELLVTMIHHSPSNYTVLITRNQQKGMASNLAIVAIALFILSSCKILSGNCSDLWLFFGVGSIFFVCSFTSWAIRSERESISNTLATIKLIKGEIDGINRIG